MILRKELLIWTATAILLTAIFGYRLSDYSGAFYFVILLLPVIIGTSYVFSEYLVPKLLLEKKYGRFTLYSIYTVIVSLNLEMIVIILAFVILANYRFEQLIPASKDVFGLATTIYLIALIKSFEKLIRHLGNKEQVISKLEESQAVEKLATIVVRANRKNVRVELDTIVYIESLADYVKIHLSSDEPIITKDKISKIAAKLPSRFLRIHRSFIVNTSQIKAYSSEIITVNNQELPIGRKYKNDVKETLQPLISSL